MIKAKCKTCGLEFYCKSDERCSESVVVPQDPNKPHECYCAKCTIEERLDDEHSVRECCYKRVADVEKEKVKFT